VQDTNGDENLRVYALDLNTQESKLLTPAKSVRSHIVGLSPNLPDHVVVAFNERDPSTYDLYKVNIKTGQRELLYQNNEFDEIWCDVNLNIAIALKSLSDGGAQLFRYEGGKFIPFRDIIYADHLKEDSIVSITDQHLYILDSKETNFKQLLQIKLKDITSLGEKAPAKVVFKDKKADVDKVLLSEKMGDILAAGSAYFKGKWHAIDPKVSKAFKSLEAKLDGNVSIVSQSLDDKHWIVSATSDVQPLSYYYYNLDNDELQFVFCVSSEFAKYKDLFAKKCAPSTEPVVENAQQEPQLP
jgi:hypothetical protein